MKKHFFFVLIFFSLVTNCFSQFSKTHYIPPLSGASTLTSEDQYLYISTPSITPINFKIIELGGITILGTVARDTPYIYYIGNGNDTQLHVDASNTSNVLNTKGYIVEADDLVYVSARVTAGSGNQAGELVSKGLASLGTRFRIGAFTNENAPSYGLVHYTFVSVLATENNTTVNFSDIKTGVQLINSTTGSNPFSITLNSGESYVMAVQGPNNANRAGLIGSLVTSDKPIALNCGSFGGTNGEMSNLDLGFDQIVPADRTGTDYIFIKSTGLNNVERVLLVADEDATEIYLNGAGSPNYTLNAGEYIALHGSDFDSNGNLYVTTKNPTTLTGKKIFAYQSVGDDGLPSQANQELFFVPPLSCQTPHVIDNIPSIDYIGSRQFTGRVTIVTQTGSTLNFIIDGIPYTLATLPGIVTGPIAVTGNANYETYVITGLTGNVSAFSSGELYLAAYGSSDAATFGGFFSGFTFKPEISFDTIDLTQSSCIPNTNLTVNSLNPFNQIDWYFNGSLITTASGNNFTPSLPGNYYVSATIASCGSPVNSVIIPVSECPPDRDNDGVNDNIDLDNDNDGLTNCTESYGDQNLNLTTTTLGTVTVSGYTNSYTGTVDFSGLGTPAALPIVGDATGQFITETAVGKDNSTSYTLTFTNPISLSLSYAQTAAAQDLLSSDTELRISCPVNRTLTILNPDNQILIDTNYDGIYENNITQYSSFEIRFRLNGNNPLAAGTGTFSIKGNNISSLKITNINISDLISKVTLRIVATCLPKDLDNDGVPDQLDNDSDNDAIPDFIENQGTTVVALSHVDVNGDGIDDIFGNGIVPANNDGDSYPNYLDLDSDNDGIFDVIESGSPGNSSNINGFIASIVGNNGQANSTETAIDSGILNYTIADSDADGVLNYIESDSDGDGCNDVIEANFADANNDGILGNDSPAVILAQGLVSSTSGYSVPNGNYSIPAPINITTQPTNFIGCELQATSLVVTPGTPVTTYQWQISTDAGATWTNLTNNAIYSGTATATLQFTTTTASMNNYQYRVFLNRTGNSCGLYSAAALITVYAKPVLSSPITLKQCDDDTDGISTFNLTQKNDVLSANYATETFRYFTTLPAATTANNLFEIVNPIAYTTGNASVFVRVENSNGCYSVGRIDLIVSATQIPASFAIPNSYKYKCDDYIDAVNDDRDGISQFNFSGIMASLQAILPNNVSIKFYKTEADFLAETDATGNSLAIPDPSNYRNIGFPNTQTIWIRVDSTVDNSCYGYKSFTIVVEALPFANPVNATNLIRHCDDNQDGFYGFDTSGINALVLNGQTNVNVTYYKSDGTQLSSPLPNPLVLSGTQNITIRVNNNSTLTGGQACYDEETLQFIVDDLPQAFPLTFNQTSFCDDEDDSLYQDGLLNIDTTDYQLDILGSQTGMNVYYYDGNNNLLASPLPNPFQTASQNVKVVVENPINTSCTAEYIIPFIINPTPKIDQDDTFLICAPSTQITLDAGIIDSTSPSAYTYQWYLNGFILPGSTNSTHIASSAGLYSVKVTNIYGCHKTRMIKVIKSEIASIQNINVTDMAEINSILVTVSGSGAYEYALDDMAGPYRATGFFNNVPIGLHELYVRDKNGCGIVGPIPVAVLGIPHYFTPNGDGFHDYWNVMGISPLSANAGSTIYIFDRYGKLLTQIKPISAGWDGTYNDHEMPGDDYWYTVEFKDGRTVNGHFTLKR